jgi:hypothetical protein
LGARGFVCHRCVLGSGRRSGASGTRTSRRHAARQLRHSYRSIWGPGVAGVRLRSPGWRPFAVAPLVDWVLFVSL